MRRTASMAAIGAVLSALAIVGVPNVAMAQAHHRAHQAVAVTWCDGTLDPGTYGRVIVPPNGVCLSDGPVKIHHGLRVEHGGTFVLGSEESGWTTGTIRGGVRSTGAASVQIHFATIMGGVVLHRGAGPFGPPFDVTWNTLEDNHIYGGARIVNYDGFWMGFIRNEVWGSVRLRHNVLQDPDGNEYVTNTIHGDMICSQNSPAPQVGDSEGQTNVVSGDKVGQCRHV